jgi:uncharacterized membrane protein
MTTTDPDHTLSRPGLDAAGREPLAIYLLLVAGLALPPLALAGAVRAHRLRARAEPWRRTHFVWQIRTFWLGLFGAGAGALLAASMPPLPLVVALACWVLARCLRGLSALVAGRPIEAPHALGP